MYINKLSVQKVLLFNRGHFETSNKSCCYPKNETHWFFYKVATFGTFMIHLHCSFISKNARNSQLSES